jgi:hypothetical protein
MANLQVIKEKKYFTFHIYKTRAMTILNVRGIMLEYIYRILAILVTDSYVE